MRVFTAKKLMRKAASVLTGLANARSKAVNGRRRKALGASKRAPEGPPRQHGTTGSIRNVEVLPVGSVDTRVNASGVRAAYERSRS